MSPTKRNEKPVGEDGKGTEASCTARACEDLQRNGVVQGSSSLQPCLRRAPARLSMPFPLSSLSTDHGEDTKSLQAEWAHACDEALRGGGIEVAERRDSLGGTCIGGATKV